MAVNAGAGGARSHGHQVEEAFGQSRTAAIVLVVLAAVTGTQLGFLLAAAPPDLMAKAAAGDEAALNVLGLCIYVVLFAIIALVCALFAWLMRSRVAMIIGLVLVGLNWVDYIFVLASGQFTLRGVVVNAIATYFLVRSLLAAIRYHRLKKQKPVDPEVFA